MFATFIFVIIAAEYDITAYSNEATILAGDPLIVKSTIHNRSPFSATIEQKNPLARRRIDWEIRKDDDWLPIMERKQGFAVRRAIAAVPLLESGAKYCEFETLMAYDSGAFVFPEVGTSEIRAVGVVQGVAIQSPPLKIVVKPRTKAQHERMVAAAKVFVRLHFFTSPRSLSDELTLLEEACGNAATIARYRTFTDTLLVGDSKHSVQDSIKDIRDKMDTVCAECALLSLAQRQFKARKYDELATVVDEFKESNDQIWEWRASLEFERLRGNASSQK